MLAVGGLLFVAGRGGGGNTAVTTILLGAVMTGIGSLLGTGGIVTLIMNYIGVNAPIIA